MKNRPIQRLLILYSKDTVIWQGAEKDCPYELSAYEQFDAIYEETTNIEFILAMLVEGGKCDGDTSSQKDTESTSDQDDEEAYCYNYDDDICNT